MIETYTFGHMIIQGREYTHDLRIAQGRVIPEWWRDGGHLVHVADIQDIIGPDTRILVIGKGSSGMMQVMPELKDWLGRRGIRLIEEPTAKALETFNRLWREGESVVAGFHLTC